MLKNSKMKTPEELWKLSPIDFNKWRSENDLPKLFEFFQSYLPSYKEWMKEYGFSEELFLNLRNPGQLFHGENEKFLISANGQDNVKYFFIDILSDKKEREIVKLSAKRGNNVIKFTPYLLWGRKKFKKSNFIPTKYSGMVGSLIYTTGTAPDVPTSCNWTILSGFTVLKLGGVKVKHGHIINDRNLDFTNMDFLEVEGKYHGNTLLEIFYSHCHNMQFTDSEIDFFQFYDCDIVKLNIQNSYFNASAFIDGNLWQLNANNSTIRNVVFHKNSLGDLNFNNTKLDSIKYIPPHKERFNGRQMTYESISKNFKSLRVAYNKTGDRNEVKDCYYFERLYDLKSKRLAINFISYFKLLKKFKLRKFFVEFLRSIRDILRYLFDLSGYLLWGWGERPGRLFLNSFAIIFLYSLLYRWFNVIKICSITESLYFSIFTFTRLGFISLNELSNGLKLLIGTETLFGWVMIGLIISGYVNKLKY